MRSKALQGQKYCVAFKSALVYYSRLGLFLLPPFQKSLFQSILAAIEALVWCSLLCLTNEMTNSLIDAVSQIIVLKYFMITAMQKNSMEETSHSEKPHIR